jgi:PHS family inorganic phosphate transporter-like MFS transporter
MGLGIGADYPLSAVITAEFAPRKYRARMLSWVFFAQPLGQLLANVLSVAAVEGFRSQITNQSLSCGTDDVKCFRAIDRLWRLVVGLGIIPAALALAFRFTIPESPRYKLDVLRNVQVVVEDTQDYFGGSKADIEGGELDNLAETPTPAVPRPAQRRQSATSEIAPDQVVDSDSESEQRRSSIDQRPVRTSMALSTSDPKYIPPLASWQDAKQFFIEEGNWRYLLGTSLSWLFLDCSCLSLVSSSYPSDLEQLPSTGLVCPRPISCDISGTIPTTQDQTCLLHFAETVSTAW